MRKLMVISFLTLDGVMQAPGGAEEDSEDDFEYGGWQVPFFEDVDEAMADDIGKAGALLLGRKTYEIFASYWPNASEGEKFTAFMNNIPKYVASRTLRKVEWRNSSLLEGDVGEAVAGLKRESGGDIIVFGSGDLAQTLMRRNLIDEFFLMIHPLTLGKGKRLFREGGSRQELGLLQSKTTKNGVIALKYRVKK